MAYKVFFSKEKGVQLDLQPIFDKLGRNISLLANGEYEIEVKKAVKKRSVNQNRLMWMWYTLLEDELGQSKKEIHEYCLSQFSSFGKILQIGDTNFNYVEVRRSSDMNTEEMTRFLEKIKTWADMEFGIHLPLPEDLGFEDFAEKYGRLVK